MCMKIKVSALYLLVASCCAIAEPDTRIDFGEFVKLAKFERSILNQMKSGPNFNENYFVAYVPCGSSCQGNIFIEYSTRKVIAQVTSCDGMDYSLESNIFIANPMLEDGHTPTCETKEYKLVDGKLESKS